MSHMRTTRTHGKHAWFQRVKHWLAHPVAGALPPMFGDGVPPELKAWKAQVEEDRREIQEVPAPPTIHNRRSKPARRK